ncbi:hypothetical protein [Mangrovimonas sp. DI 80]|uniref:hypothetical protein n=1 Tax=Mangrovimonas sp. DI 80 TaxID=1779330 RepID=UPI000976454F|nr:hypothetical protein [Mangrovimonas sp. DI 80]OMP32332.1 hypothetical protein BKM32_04585 [Mangrovimonas sp. DI 80]
MLKGFRNLILQTSLVAVLLLYLFVPIHKEALTMLHTLSHSLETALKARQDHLNKHNHHFMVSSGHHEHSHDHVSDHEHSDPSAHQHKHGYISLLASFFSSAESNTNQQEQHTTLLQFDKHILPLIHRFHKQNIRIPRKTNWCVCSRYYAIYLPINLPPPKAS